ncbi:MAG: sel1 repeat family protein, partial [Gammaproteobacteria bacterium]|nr:sel1 repeat family protein [Gammaproteobacteria bacterium]
QGEISAQFNLARCYDEHPDFFKEDSSPWLQKAGAGLVTLNEEEDERHALKKINFTPEDFSYLDKQREQDNPVAKVILAQLHQGGHGVPQYRHKAYALLTEAAGQDDLLAQYCLGLAGMKGQGTRISPKRARKYFNQVLNVLKQGEMSSYLKTAEKTRQDKSRDYPQDIKLWLGLMTQTKLRLLDLEKSEENLEDLISTLAHEFRGSLSILQYNATHENEAERTEKSVNVMRGMLNVFGVISTGADKLQQQFMQDMSGDCTLSGTLVQALLLAVIQLLPVHSQSITQHYMAYARRTRLLDQPV